MISVYFKVYRRTSAKTSLTTWHALPLLEALALTQHSDRYARDTRTPQKMDIRF